MKIKPTFAMLSEPKIEKRDRLHYVAIPKTVHMNDIPQVLPPLIPEVKQWMLERGIEMAGPDFFFYKSMDKNGLLECEAGFPASQAVKGDGRIVGGFFPAGTYASLIYTGDFRDMMQGYKALEEWIEAQGLKEKAANENDRQAWGGRTEFYLVDPELEPDPAKWQTEIVFLLED